MSAAHTEGRITFREDGDASHWSMLTEDGRWWLAVLANGEQISERQQANFRRLAACWNACVGLSTEDLEKRAGGSMITALEAEILEQARINGMGAEREAALMGKVERLESEQRRLQEALLQIADPRRATQDPQNIARTALEAIAQATPFQAEAVHPISGMTADVLWMENGRLRAQLADLKANAKVKA